MRLIDKAQDHRGQAGWKPKRKQGEEDFCCWGRRDGDGEWPDRVHSMTLWGSGASFGYHRLNCGPAVSGGFYLIGIADVSPENCPKRCSGPILAVIYILFKHFLLILRTSKSSRIKTRAWLDQELTCRGVHSETRGCFVFLTHGLCFVSNSVVSAIFERG